MNKGFRKKGKHRNNDGPIFWPTGRLARRPYALGLARRDWADLPSHAARSDWRWQPWHRVERSPNRRRASNNDDPSEGQQEEKGSVAYMFWGLGALGIHRARPSTAAVLAVEGWGGGAWLLQRSTTTGQPPASRGRKEEGW
jgi:hypothetical protein